MNCYVCGRSAPNQCSKCKTIYYCSRACQSADWCTHKAECKQLCYGGPIFNYLETKIGDHIWQYLAKYGGVEIIINESWQAVCEQSNMPHFGHLRAAPGPRPVCVLRFSDLVVRKYYTGVKSSSTEVPQEKIIYFEA